MKKISYSESLARSIQNWGEQDPRIHNSEMKRWRKVWKNRGIKLTTKDYNTHVAVRITVNGVKVGWIQIERDNLAFYGTSAKNSMSDVIYFATPRGPICAWPDCNEPLYTQVRAHHHTEIVDGKEKDVTGI